MRQTISVPIDTDTMLAMDRVCAEVGLDVTTVFQMLATRIAADQRIPDGVLTDPFYSESNMRHLRAIMQKIEDGTAHFSEHELIEDND